MMRHCWAPGILASVTQEAARPGTFRHVIACRVMKAASWRIPGRRSAQMRLIPASALPGLYARSDLQGAWRTGAHVGLLVATGASIHAARGHWWLPAALLAHVLVLVALFAAMHEAVHYSAFKSRRVNEVVAWLAGFGILFNATYYRQFHFAHHRHPQDPSPDPGPPTGTPARSRVR